MRSRCALPATGIVFVVAFSGAAALPGAVATPVARGGRVAIAVTSEPKTLNPLTAADQTTRDVLSALSADLVHINRATLRTEPALAASWSISPDGLHYTVTLRDGLRFSDGAPLTADDVVFTFQVHLDPRVNSPQRDLLIVDGKPMGISKVSPTTIRFDLPAPYAPAERLFDAFWILPKHRLERAYLDGRIQEAWSLGTPPADVVTAGAFRVRQYVPGQRLTIERNPFYWKHDEDGQPLPYLDSIDVVFAGDQNGQLLRLLSHDVAAASKLRPEDLARLEQTPGLQVRDAGPSLEYNFLFFNWNAPPPVGDWARSLKFRQAMAWAVDRAAIVRLVYQGRAAALSSAVTPGNRLWRADGVVEYGYDPARAARLLEEAGFRRQVGGPLVDAAGRPVEFSLMVSASSQARRKMATLVQDDLAKIGIAARLQPIEFGVMLDAVTKTRRFDAAVWGIASGDADPNADVNVWATSGTLHVWNMKAANAAAAPPPEPWEVDVDRLMRAQMIATTVAARKAAYDQVQQLVSANAPLVFLASPHVLAAADRALGNFEPGILDPVLLWNADRWFWARPQS